MVTRVTYTVKPNDLMNFQDMSVYISNTRLSTYTSILKINDPNQVIRAYYWNIALCSAIYPLLHTLEITFRNALDHSVRSHHQPPTTTFPSYNGDTYWFEKIVQSIQDRKISKMRADKKKFWINSSGKRLKFSTSESHIIRARSDLLKESRHPSAGDLLSRVPFGFWTTLLEKDYEDITNKHLLWPNLTQYVFPNAPANTSRSDIEERFRIIRELRNRLSHHEPVWKLYARKPNGDLDYSAPIYGLNAIISLIIKQYDSILEIIKWMSSDAYQSFISAKMNIEFNKLCSQDGFYAYVSPEKIRNRKSLSRAKREFFKYIEAAQNINVIYIKSNNKRGLVLGINEPNLP